MATHALSHSEILYYILDSFYSTFQRKRKKRSTIDRLTGIVKVLNLLPDLVILCLNFFSYLVLILHWVDICIIISQILFYLKVLYKNDNSICLGVIQVHFDLFLISNQKFNKLIET